MHFATFLFLLCCFVLVGVSLLTPAPRDEDLVNVTFSSLQAADDKDIGDSPRARLRDRVLTAVLIAAVAGLWLYFSGCSGGQPAKVPAAEPTAAETSQRPRIPAVEALLEKMSLRDKLGQLLQYAGDYKAKDGKPQLEPEMLDRIREGAVGSFLSVLGAETTCELQRIAVDESPHGIPLLFAFDVIHGLRTTAPVPLAEAASFDPVAVEQGARIAAVEASAAGVHWTFAPMIDIARDARWGRIVEGAGEDPALGAEMAAARVRGFQGEDLSAIDTVLACAKHFVAYGLSEGGRDYATAEVSERALREIYFPPFQAAMSAGVATVMTAFSDVSGVPATGNAWLLDEVLRGEWGFGGLVVSDWESVKEQILHGVAATPQEAAMLALEAGTDIDMVSAQYAELETVSDPRIEAWVTRSTRRVLEAKHALGLLDDPYRYCSPNREAEVILSKSHRQAARDMATKSIVLLKNKKNVLPLDSANPPRTLAVIGDLADDALSTLGPWSDPGRPEDVITVLRGIREAAPAGTEVVYAQGTGSAGARAEAVRLARRANAVLLVIGETAELSGEAHSRSSIELPPEQDLLARAVVEGAGKPVIVILMNGRPLAVPWLAERAGAIIEAWFLGVEMGPAVADVVFGAANPGGKLPVTFPRATGQVPIYYNLKRTGRPGDPEVRYTSKYIDLEITPLYPFGHGLSYASFVYGGLEIEHDRVAAGDWIRVSGTVENTSKRDGDEVVQLYVRDEVASVSPPVMELAGFARVPLAAGEKKTVSFEIPVSRLAVYDRKGDNTLEPGPVELLIGSSSTDIRARATVEITGEPTVVPAHPYELTKVTVR